MTEPADLSLLPAMRKEGDLRKAGGILALLQREPPADGMLQAFDLRAIAGLRHVESALRHARRAVDEGRSRLKDPGALMALYLGGTDQLERAISRVGISADTHDLLLVASPARDLLPLLDRLGLVPGTPGLPESPSLEVMRRLEIDPRLYATRDPGEWEYVVLEHIAMVDFTQHRPASGGRSGAPGVGPGA